MKALKSIISVSLAAIILFRIATPVNATTIDADDVYDVVYSGLLASSAISDVEEELDDVSFDFSDVDYTDYDSDWIDDARDFIDTNSITPLNLNSINTQEVTNEQAMAASISYSIECAVWSLNKGRCTINTVGDEASYMFISHYIDRTEYYWSNNNYQYLMDGPSMSENPSYFSRWITNYDRSAYDTYILQSGKADTFQSIKNLGVGFYSLFSDNMAVGDIVDDLDRVSSSALAFESVLHTARVSYDYVDIDSDIDYIAQSLLNDAGVHSVSYLYSTMISDDNLLSDLDSSLRSQLISCTISFSLSVLLGDIAGGALGIGISILSLTIDEYIDLFQFAVWVSMRNSFTTREPWRYNDYLMDLYF